MIRNSLFISNSKKKIIKRIASILFVITVFSLAINLLNYMYQDEDDYERVKWHSFYEQAGDIKTVFTGSSHVYCGINPECYYELSGSKSFDLAGPVLRLSATYYALREAVKYNELDTVYLDMYSAVSANTLGGSWNWDTFKNDWKTTDNLRPSLNRELARIDLAFSTGYYADVYIPMIRFREHLFDVDYVKSVIHEKTSEDYKNYIYRKITDDGLVEYRDNGFLYTDITLKAENRAGDQEYILSEENNFDPRAEAYLDKIIKLCEKEDIKLCLIAVPVIPLGIDSTLNYDAYCDRIKEISKENNIPFYDFNLVKNEYFDSSDVNQFLDLGHLNVVGAERFTRLLWEVVNSDAPEQYFYDSFEEKRNSEGYEFWGIYRSIVSVDSRNVVLYSISTSNDDGVEYRIRIINNGMEEETLVSDYSDNKEFIGEMNQPGECIIDVRNTETGKIETHHIRY